MHTADRVQNADQVQMQTADCRLGTKRRLRMKTVFCEIRDNVIL